MTEQVDSIVIGAGAVGLAVARALALGGREVLVLEKTGLIGSGISSRNSEVLHAGIYYPAGSLKARLCVAGRRALEAYCPAHGVTLRQCGKLIVGRGEDDAERLHRLLELGRTNGVDDLRMLTGEQARALEGALDADVALLSPSTGILDSHALMLALQADLEDAGGLVAFHTPVTGGTIDAEGIEIRTGGEAPMRLRCRTLVNAAGLDAIALARSLSGLNGVPGAYYAKGNYFELRGRAPFSRLIYPAPVPGGLGIHLTLDLSGRARFGPDVEWIDVPNFDVDPTRADAFYAAIRRYWPALPDGALQSGYAGVRPKLSGPGEPAADFRIDDASVHGVAGLVNLFGIESPGLTACLAIGEEVAARVD